MTESDFRTPAPALAARAQGLDAVVGYRLRRVGALVVKELGRIFDAIGLAPGQFSILILIAARPACSQTDLARLASIDRSTLVPVINRLMKLGFVARAPNKRDRRAYHLSVTSSGARAISVVLPDIEAFEKKITRHLTGGDKDRLLVALRGVENAIILDDAD